MSKRPKTRRPKPGEVWHVKRGVGRVVLTGELHEIDGDTFVIQWLADGAVQPRTTEPLRFDRNDFEFIKRVSTAA